MSTAILEFVMELEWGNMRQRVRSFANAVIRPSMLPRNEVQPGLDNQPSSSNSTIFINVRSGEGDSMDDTGHDKIQWNNVKLYLTVIKPTLLECYKPRNNKRTLCIRVIQVRIVLPIK